MLRDTFTAQNRRGLKGQSALTKVEKGQRAFADSSQCIKWRDSFHLKAIPCRSPTQKKTGVPFLYMTQHKSLFKGQKQMSSSSLISEKLQVFLVLWSTCFFPFSFSFCNSTATQIVTVPHLTSYAETNSGHSKQNALNNQAHNNQNVANSRQEWGL